MNDSRSILILVGAVAFGAMSDSASFGQGFMKGDEVIALRDAPLNVEAKVVGTVHKGDKFVVEEVQDDWLWVRSGETRGWIDARHVVWGLKGSWEVTSARSRGVVITFGGGFSGSMIRMGDARRNTVIIWKPWTYDGKTISFSSWRSSMVFDIGLNGKWKTVWQGRDTIQVTDAEGNKMLLTRRREKEEKPRKTQ